VWHGDKAALHLGADVLDVRPVRAGQHAGYRQSTVTADGSLVVMELTPRTGVYVLSDLSTGPLLFATC